MLGDMRQTLRLRFREVLSIETREQNGGRQGRREGDREFVWDRCRVLAGGADEGPERDGGRTEGRCGCH